MTDNNNDQTVLTATSLLSWGMGTPDGDGYLTIDLVKTEDGALFLSFAEHENEEAVFGSVTTGSPFARFADGMPDDIAIPLVLAMFAGPKRLISAEGIDPTLMEDLFNDLNGSHDDRAIESLPDDPWYLAEADAEVQITEGETRSGGGQW